MNKLIEASALVTTSALVTLTTSCKMSVLMYSVLLYSLNYLHKNRVSIYYVVWNKLFY